MKPIQPYLPRTPVPGSKVITAKRLLRGGASLLEAALAVDLPTSVLDQELWRTIGHPLREDPRS